jgi:hypothetical protein
MQRRRFRFKLGTLMIAIAVAALALVVMMPLWNRHPSVDPFDATEMIDGQMPGSTSTNRPSTMMNRPGKSAPLTRKAHNPSPSPVSPWCACPIGMG